MTRPAHQAVPGTPRWQEQGVVLFEVMIAIVILAVGLLGLAKLQVSTRQLEMESYQRTQALILLQDMSNRLTANIAAGACYAITDLAGGAPYLGYGGGAPANCGIGTLTQQNAALNDLTQWHNLLSGASESDEGALAGAMVGARGCISLDVALDGYVITVAWQGLLESSAPAAGLSCAINLYGSEPRRRVVSAFVRIPRDSTI